MMSFWRPRPPKPDPESAIQIAPSTTRIVGGASEVVEEVAVVQPTPASSYEGELLTLPLDLIDSNPFQPRQSFDRETLVELAASISEFGVLQPVIVRRDGERYQLIAGERRTRAARLAGYSSIPALLREMDDTGLALLSLIENLQRESLNVIEEALSYARLLVEFELTQEELARRLGRSQSSVANKLRLLRLPAVIQESLILGHLSERHARALLRLPHEELQKEALQLIVELGLSVRQTEAWVEEALHPEDKDSTKTKARRRRFVPKDMLLFFNEFRSVVQTMQQAGISAEYLQEEEEDSWKVIVRIKKHII